MPLISGNYFVLLGVNAKEALDFFDWSLVCQSNRIGIRHFFGIQVRAITKVAIPIQSRACVEC
jgi:hypothetical protein